MTTFGEWLRGIVEHVVSERLSARMKRERFKDDVREQAAGAALAWFMNRTNADESRRKDLIEMGQRVGFPYVPGEDIDRYRRRLVEMRDKDPRSFASLT